MTDWFYERNGSKIGPISQEMLLKAYNDCIINRDNLVWNEQFGERWVRLDEAQLEIPIRNEVKPPPLPNEMARVEGNPNGTNSSNDNFLESETTSILIGKKSGYYLAKWAKMLGKVGEDTGKIKSLTWNWSAFLFSIFWFYYRKLWIPAAAISILFILIAVWGPESESDGRALSFGIALVCGLIGNWLYLKQTQATWQKLEATGHSTANMKELASRRGGTNAWAPIAGAGVLSLFLVVVDSSLGLSTIFGSSTKCSSGTVKDTVEKIARENMTKIGLNFAGIDIAKTGIFLEAIRTRDGSKRQTECAASIKYKVKLASSVVGGKEIPAENLAIIENEINSDITYSVEAADDGKNVYVTVRGLKQ